MLEIVLAFSMHGIPGDFNEVHPGLRYENTPYMASVYHNSDGKVSAVVGLVGRSGPWFGEIGLATGYEYPIVPMGRAGIETDNLRFFVFPAVTKTDVGIGVGVEFRITAFGGN